MTQNLKWDFHNACFVQPKFVIVKKNNNNNNKVIKKIKWKSRKSLHVWKLKWGVEVLSGMKLPNFVLM